MDDFIGKDAFPTFPSDSPSKKVVQVFGTSMWPYLQNGDLIVTQDLLGSQDLRPGSIVGFHTEVDDALSFHRLISPIPFQLKGDAEAEFDNSLYTEIDVQSLATHRLIAFSRVSVAVSLQQGLLSPLHRLVARLSGSHGQSSCGFSASLRFLTLVVLGQSLRGLEYVSALCQSLRGR